MDCDMNRRTFVKGSMLASAGAALSGAIGSAADPPPKGPAQPKDVIPSGKIGKLTIGRLLLGTNPIGLGYVHTHGLTYASKLADAYSTDAKIRETFAMAEAHGVNMVAGGFGGRFMKLLKAYREKDGGKILVLAASDHPRDAAGLAQFDVQVQRLIDNGADAIYLGAHGLAKKNLAQKDVDLVAKAVEIVKNHGIPCGVGGHDTAIVVECEKVKMPHDFYVKTFHHKNYAHVKLTSDSCWCPDPEKLIEVMKAVEKPWIAFKTMAAGAIPPKSAFPWCFKNGADFILAGMFDFEIAEDVKIAKQAFEDAQQRERPWRA